MLVFRALAVLILYLFATIPAMSQGWEVITDWVDPFVGEKIAAAQTTNSDGFAFTLFRSEDGRVRVLYSLPKSSFDRLPKEGRVVMIRPDEHSSKEVKAELSPDRWGQWTRSDGLVVRDLIWHGGDPSPTNGTLRNILNSKKLFARFFTDDGRTIDTVWSLENSHPAIGRALGIKTEISQEEQDWAQFVTETLIATAQRCGINPDCTDALSACFHHLADARDEPLFVTCMQDLGF